MGGGGPDEEHWMKKMQIKIWHLYGDYIVLLPSSWPHSLVLSPHEIKRTTTLIPRDGRKVQDEKVWNSVNPEQVGWLEVGWKQQQTHQSPL